MWGGARQGLMPGNGIGCDFGTMGGGSGTFWAIPENLSGEKRSSVQKQVGPKEANWCVEVMGGLEPAGWESGDPAAQGDRQSGPGDSLVAHRCR